ncbi:hypothetical protein CYIG_00067 [Cyanophage NATL1A-7]|uniref:Predicted protein n=1 Tax=Cyanophage NATL1A-7 TaxID=445693 RepID=E3SND6_9CAUD|nr:hypothetical protein CYIG_00067 [Cyanophage NATL1A-7]ADP00140.1 predicted protein [Cyanophage NATL1A-7]
MCGAAAIGAVAGVGQAIAGYQAEVAGQKARNKAKLKNFERQNVQYLTDVMLDNAQYKQDQISEDVKQDQLYQNMINQWRDNDRQLDEIFAKGNFKMERAIREMYQNDYAGTQTGATAARLAGKSTKEMGFKKAEYVHEMLMAEKTAYDSKDRARDKAMWDSWDMYEKVRYAPIHGHAPVAPLLEAKPSPLGAIFGAVGSIAGGFED